MIMDNKKKRNIIFAIASTDIAFVLLLLILLNHDMSLKYYTVYLRVPKIISVKDEKRSNDVFYIKVSRDEEISCIELKNGTIYIKPKSDKSVIRKNIKDFIINVKKEHNIGEIGIYVDKDVKYEIVAYITAAVDELEVIPFIFLLEDKNDE